LVNERLENSENFLIRGILSGSPSVLFLWWSDQPRNATNDYNLYLVDSTGAVIDSSQNVQNGLQQDPFEGISVNVLSAFLCVFLTNAPFFCFFFKKKRTSTLGKMDHCTWL